MTEKTANSSHAQVTSSTCNKVALKHRNFSDFKKKFLYLKTSMKNKQGQAGFLLISRAFMNWRFDWGAEWALKPIPACLQLSVYEHVYPEQYQLSRELWPHCFKRQTQDENAPSSTALAFHCFKIGRSILFMQICSEDNVKALISQ